MKKSDKIVSAATCKSTGVYTSKEGLDSKDTKYPDRGKQSSPKIFG